LASLRFLQHLGVDDQVIFNSLRVLQPKDGWLLPRSREYP
jgi:hypothetical protein